MKKVMISLNLDKEDKIDLQKVGINLSSFFRQAVKAWKNGEFTYNYLERVNTEAKTK